MKKKNHVQKYEKMNIFLNAPLFISEKPKNKTIMQ